MKTLNTENLIERFKDFHGKYECFKKENLVLDTFRNWQGRPVLNFYPKDYK